VSAAKQQKIIPPMVNDGMNKRMDEWSCKMQIYEPTIIRRQGAPTRNNNPKFSNKIKKMLFNY